MVAGLLYAKLAVVNAQQEQDQARGTDAHGRDEPEVRVYGLTGVIVASVRVGQFGGDNVRAQGVENFYT